VNIRVAGTTYSDCETRDLSIKGVFVVGVNGPRQGDLGDLELCLSGTSSKVSLRMESEVVRIEEDGIALHFKGMDIDSFFHLRNIVYHNSGDPDSLEGFPIG
jgi:hypothetical protein